MANNTIYQTLNWRLIATLSIVALARPLMSILGISDALGKPAASITATILITIVWVATVYFKQVSQPILTLVFVGIGYAILAILISGILSPILTGHLQGPLANPFAIISILMTNIVWGLVAGLIVITLNRFKQR
ncbi:hypothetical protein LQF63_12085 [Tetragenococcus koreensis]|uniref:hypothetical protein n=1 Tax=Tetragenococcus koreensis TaxID=290335 RepID=UPI001F42B354|nr:hypothetical protein [Tetragenococcus koreensis]MCF1618365.1 hypothetical protein [Tetragenococcus koreensis]MDN6701670.1 hypothetical protein [Tetragenococcus koreensis]